MNNQKKEEKSKDKSTQTHWDKIKKILTKKYYLPFDPSYKNNILKEKEWVEKELSDTYKTKWLENIGEFCNEESEKVRHELEERWGKIKKILTKKFYLPFDPERPKAEPISLADLDSEKLENNNIWSIIQKPEGIYLDNQKLGLCVKIFLEEEVEFLTIEIETLKRSLESYKNIIIEMRKEIKSLEDQLIK